MAMIQVVRATLGALACGTRNRAAGSDTESCFARIDGGRQAGHRMASGRCAAALASATKSPEVLP